MEEWDWRWVGLEKDFWDHGRVGSLRCGIMDGGRHCGEMGVVEWGGSEKDGNERRVGTVGRRE